MALHVMATERHSSPWPDAGRAGTLPSMGSELLPSTFLVGVACPTSHARHLVVDVARAWKATALERPPHAQDLRRCGLREPGCWFVAAAASNTSGTEQLLQARLGLGLCGLQVQRPRRHEVG